MWTFIENIVSISHPESVHESRVFRNSDLVRNLKLRHSLKYRDNICR